MHWDNVRLVLTVEITRCGSRHFAFVRLRVEPPRSDELSPTISGESEFIPFSYLG